MSPGGAFAPRCDGVIPIQGLPVPDNDAAIQEGRTMCVMLDQGTTRPLLVMRPMRDTHLTARQAGFFLGSSSAAYCPQYRTTVSG